MSTLLQKVQSGELTPIIYMPMADSATCHLNYGTGGNFVQNGTLDTASRGANQDNCKASYFDGTADYLSRTSLTGIADGKQLTVSATLKNTTGGYFFNCDDGTYNGFRIDFSSGRLAIVMYDSATSVVFNGGVNLGIPSGKTVAISFSIDMDDVNKIRFFADGVQKTITTSTFTVGGIVDFTKNNYLICKRNTVRSYYGGNIGELYFDTKYIDLATNNPFWDSVENKPIPVRKAMANLGSNPLICMPIDASNPGKNYGTGGDFTANSAPYVGARGGSEFWARSAKFDGSTGYLSRGALSGAVDSKTFSGLVVIKPLASVAIFYISSCADSGMALRRAWEIYITASTLYIRLYNSSGDIILNSSVSFSFSSSTTYSIEFCMDLNNTSNRFIFINGVSQTVTWSIYTNSLIPYSSVGAVMVAQDFGASRFFNGEQSLCYFTTSYIDFSQEVNRNKFIDQLGYPKDLSKQIDAGVIPKPLFYLPFDDPTNLGKDASGNNNHFTVNGTVTQGADVNG